MLPHGAYWEAECKRKLLSARNEEMFHVEQFLILFALCGEIFPPSNFDTVAAISHFWLWNADDYHFLDYFTFDRSSWVHSLRKMVRGHGADVFPLRCPFLGIFSLQGVSWGPCGR
jgi:hypothetical protein